MSPITLIYLKRVKVLKYTNTIGMNKYQIYQITPMVAAGKKTDIIGVDMINNKLIPLKMELTDLTDTIVNFKLAGIIVHSGTLASGHYFALIKTQKDEWYYCSDEEIKRMLNITYSSDIYEYINGLPSDTCTYSMVLYV